MADEQCARTGKDEQVAQHVLHLQGLADYGTAPSYLGDLRRRAGDRPATMGCLPHAQMEQQSPDEVFEALKAQAAHLFAPFKISSGKSTVSMPSTYPAYHLCEPCTMPEEACMTPGGPRCGKEFAHVHTLFRDDSDPFVVESKKRGEPWQAYQGGGQGSLHLCLTIKDAATVLSAGWGELHLLAGKTMGPGVCIPRGLVLVYAPQTQEEVDVVIEILRASLLFATSGSGSGK
jgi:hypothetical protein